MKSQESLFKPMLSIITAALLAGSPMAGARAAAGSGSDYAFNEMLQEMAGRDTGSQWFDYYVETLNQEIAFRFTEEPYGAAGPNGPLVGFDGYVANFTKPDTGSIWFDTYVDSVNRTLREKGY